MADKFDDFDDDASAPGKRDGLFLWTVLILLLIGAAFACWLGSFHIFGHPENARNYRILQRLKKIERLKRFEETKAPPGEFLSAQKLFERYSKYSSLQLENENAEILRIFVTNFRETKKLVPYVRGNFTIAAAGTLTDKDFMTSGMVALGQANEFPQVLIEHLYPMNAENTAKSKRLLVVGNPIKLEKTYDLGAVIHVERMPEGRMQFTVVPLMYGSYALAGGEGTFSTEPPADLHIEGGLPVMNVQRVETAMKSFAEFRRRQPAPEPGETGETPAPKVPQIVRLDAVPDGAKVPETGALPQMPVATPIPIAGRGTPTPRRGAPTVAANVPEVAPLASVPRGVIKPFISSNREPGLPDAKGNSWTTYKRGAVPAGNVMSATDAAALADRGSVPPRTYLRGNFVVRVTGEDRAVIRPRAGADAAPTASVRVIVEYANGTVPPAEGVALDRDETTPFEIRDVRRGATGELNIWVREIVQ